MIIHGNNIDKLKDFPDNYFDSIVTDPPYGLGKEPDAVELMKDWVQKGYHEITGSGFMGKEWDAFVPQPIFWKEVFRVLKHGGHVLSFFGTRTYDWGVMSMRFAGFEVRDCIQWLYGSGFPKSHNISKAIDKMYGAEREVLGNGKWNDRKINGSLGINSVGLSTKADFKETIPSTDQAKKWDGWGSALKPANEPIVLARKPLEKGLSIAENVIKWGTGAINIDGCRVGYQKDDHVLKYEGYSNGGYKSQYDEGSSYKHGNQVQINKDGRFPANLILTHHPNCQCLGLKKVNTNSHFPNMKVTGFGENYGGKTEYIEEGDRIKEETIEHWECVEDCPIKIMDEQSGILKSGRLNSDSYVKERDNNSIFAGGGNFQHKGYLEDSGGASRFFYVAKASKSERNRGLNGFEQKPLAFSNQAKAELKRGNINYDGGEAKGHGNSIRHLKNFHPTVKPVKLMQYLVRLITPPHGKVLDPFCGSGTTGIACKLEGFEFIGIEQDAEYCKIAEARIVNYTGEPKEELKLIEENQENKATQLQLF